MIAVEAPNFVREYAQCERVRGSERAPPHPRHASTTRVCPFCLTYYLTKSVFKFLPRYLVTVMKHPVNYDVFWNVRCDERPEAVTSGLTMRAPSRLMTFGSCCKPNCTGTSPHHARQRVRRPVRKVKC